MIDPDEGFLKTNSLPTAGAITVQDAQGRLVTQKVKVRRYAAGKLPEYAKNALMNDDDDDDDDDNDQEEKDDIEQVKTSAVSHNEQEDRRMRRLQARDLDDNDNERERINRHRRIMEPEVLEPSSEEEEEEAEEEENDEEEKMETDETVNRSRVKMDIESSSDDEELNEEQIERHRQLLRQKAKEREEELLQVEEEEEDAEEDDEDEDEESEEESEEEEDDGVPRLKPVFVRKDDRRTVAEREAEEKKQIQLEIEKKRIADQRKVQSQKMVADAIRQEKLAEKKTEDGIQCDFDTDDDDSEVAYDAWKLRELTRLKRDREERDQREREQQELERWHNMTEDERQAELRKNPKLIDNQIKKTKYKFLQKYYHRGAFFMDTNEDVYKRDISEPTLEDLFDKTVLPKVMQVKNFGMAGRTKYTHLVDQDTTVKDSPWALDKQTAKKFHNEHAGGLKQEFDRPKLKKTSKK